ncbi:MAG: TerB family tellurite resistance protein [Longimicrobiales bacterium]|nr:TerB family tellurite resistance protein [Longimicrobiales bacterium]
MIDAIRDFFRATMEPDPDETPDTRSEDLRLAACALMLELAWADEAFTDAERTHLEGAVRRHFGLDPAQAEALIEMAEGARREATDLYRFTRLIREEYSLGQKMVLAEILWGLVYADGELSSHEDLLLRKISGLLDLEVAYLSEARNRARHRDAGPDDASRVD